MFKEKNFEILKKSKGKQLHTNNLAMSSPLKKKMRIVEYSDESESKNELKRRTEATDDPSKRPRTDKSLEGDLQAKKRKNFITACEIVSYKAYFDQCCRLQLVYLPTCAKSSVCTHHDNKSNFNVKQMPSYAEESFKIEMKTNMWREALEVCRLCITPEQYLSANVLKDIVEIMLNAHNDEYTDYNIDYLITKCQQVFELNFSYHPPCLVKSLRKCYNDFLSSPLDQKEQTFTNRSQFGYDKGVVKYCLNRLEHEISEDSKDEPFVDKYENIPEEMKQSVKGLHWQKEKFEIYELLNRSERIERLIAVLDSVIELLQFDLAIWHTRYTNNLGCHIMRSHKPLMASFLWSNNVLYTGAVNNNCRQILRLFVHLIHLQYPETHIRIMTLWLNTMIQTFYICENNSNTDYPNTGKYCTVFANEFYKIISGMPEESIIRVLERIKPDYMQYLIGTLHVKTLLSIQEDNPIRILTDFIKTSQWKQFSETETDIKVFKKPEQSYIKVKNFFNFLNKKCEALKSSSTKNLNELNSFRKLDHTANVIKSDISLNDVVYTLYVTLEAYLDAYSVQNMQEAIDTLNQQLQNGEMSTNNNSLPQFCSYSVTENFIKKYRSIYQALRELMILLQEMNNSGQLPESLKVFGKIGLLGM